MSTLTYDRIKIHGAFGLSILHDLELHVQPNKHAQVKFSGIVDQETGFTEIQKQIEGREITIEIQEENNKTTSLFSGFAQEILITREGEIYYIQGTLISGTSQLDTKKKSRSFQDVSMTYRDVINQILEDTPHAAVICTVGKDTKIEKPLIQYQETD